MGVCGGGWVGVCVGVGLWVCGGVCVWRETCAVRSKAIRKYNYSSSIRNKGQNSGRSHIVTRWSKRDRSLFALSWNMTFGKILCVNTSGSCETLY